MDIFTFFLSQFDILLIYHSSSSLFIHFKKTAKPSKWSGMSQFLFFKQCSYNIVNDLGGTSNFIVY